MTDKQLLEFGEDNKIFESLEDAEEGTTLCTNLAEDIAILLHDDPGAVRLNKTTRALIDILLSATDAADSALHACKEEYRAKLLEKYGEEPVKWKEERETRRKDLEKYTGKIKDLQRLAARVEFQSGDKLLREGGAVITTNQIETRKTLEEWENGGGEND